LQQLERLQQLEQLQRLANLEQLANLNNFFTTSNLSYKDVKINTPIEETIIYLDPPYRNTEKYIEGKDFDYKELDQWFKNNKYTCFMSEYNAPHKVIFEIDKFSLLNNSKEKKKVVKEKLFWNNN
jgi:site-specific DNA-adenine methylase